MKIIILPFLLLVGFISVAQTESLPKFEAGVVYSSLTIGKSELYSGHVRKKYGYAFGLNTSCYVGKKSYLDLTFLYTDRRYEIRNLTMDNSLNTQTGSFDTVYHAQYSLRYIEIPLTFHYVFVQSEKFRLDAGAGMSAIFSTGQRESFTAYAAGGDVIENYRVRNLQYDLSAFGATIGVKLMYTPSHRVGFYFEPYSRNYFTKKVHLFSDVANTIIGANTGIVYRF